MPADASQPRPQPLAMPSPQLQASTGTALSASAHPYESAAPHAAAPEASGPDFHFGQASRPSHSEQPVPLGGVPRALREAAELAGLDPTAELFNEAQRYANEGHLRLARERLQMLLCMAPDDGEARLMLARINVAGQKWQDALSALDEAQSCGVSVPSSLRRAVEEHLRAEEASAEEHRAALRAREQGEIKALRQEARRVRSENAQLIGRCAELERETRKWAWTTVGVSVIAILFIGANLMLSGGSSDPAPDTVMAPGTPTAEVAPAGAEARPDTATLASRAAQALAAAHGMEDTALEVEVAGQKATVRGEVLAHRQLLTAREVLGSVEGIEHVDSNEVQVIARTRGTVHVVQRGDTPSHIARSYYGDSTLAAQILRANRGTTASNLRIGQELTIPAIP